MMKRILTLLLVVCFNLTTPAGAPAQQIPYLSELLSRDEEFVRLCTEKRRAGANLSAIEPVRKRVEDAFKAGNIPGIIEAVSEGSALLTGKKWDDRQRFISSLTLEVDRLVVEPNQALNVSLARMFPVNIDKIFNSTPTVSFVVIPGERSSRGRDTTQPAPQIQPTIVAQSLPVAATSSNATRRLLLADGAYDVVATVEAGGQKLAEIKRPIYAIGNFSDSLSQMTKKIAALKSSGDVTLRTMAATPEFQLQRLAQLSRSRGDVPLNPPEEIDHIEAEITALSRGENPFAKSRGEIELAYQAPDGALVPYRVYVPKSYDGAASKPLVVMLHGALGDERSFFSGVFDPALIEGEAERRGYVLAGVSGRGRFATYTGPSLDDVFEVTNAVTRDYKIDASRVYLLGHSTGAFGAWLVASSKPERFVAVAAVSGGPPAQGDALTQMLGRLKGLPVLVVHGAQDGIVPVQFSRTIAAAAEKAGLKVSSLEVPDADHMSVVVSTFPAIMDFFDKNAKADVK
jgi:predicted esterase